MNAISSNPLSRILRKTTKIFWARQTLEHLESIRQLELELALQSFPTSGKVLEIGAGTGWQAKKLQEHGFEVEAIDLDISNYKSHRVFPVIDYDGRNIPFDDDTFDIVFSSNVMEHIPHIDTFQSEIHRVLKPGGLSIHVIPSSAWRIWTSITCFIKTWKTPEIHGEHSHSLLGEAMVFRRKWWQRLFERTGWTLIDIQPIRLFYTGCSVMDKRINLKLRQHLAAILGGSMTIFLMKADSRTEE